MYAQFGRETKFNTEDEFVLNKSVDIVHRVMDILISSGDALGYTKSNTENPVADMDRFRDMVDNVVEHELRIKFRV